MRVIVILLWGFLLPQIDWLLITMFIRWSRPWFSNRNFVVLMSSLILLILLQMMLLVASSLIMPAPTLALILSFILALLIPCWPFMNVIVLGSASIIIILRILLLHSNLLSRVIFLYLNIHVPFSWSRVLMTSKGESVTILVQLILVKILIVMVNIIILVNAWWPRIILNWAQTSRRIQSIIGRVPWLAEVQFRNVGIGVQYCRVILVVIVASILLDFFIVYKFFSIRDVYLILKERITIVFWWNFSLDQFIATFRNLLAQLDGSITRWWEIILLNWARQEARFLCISVRRISYS